jgi:hypothetical protein
MMREQKRRVGSDKMGYRKLLYPVVLKTFPSLASYFVIAE